jgi:hypothetical protein
MTDVEAFKEWYKNRKLHNGYTGIGWRIKGDND